MAPNGISSTRLHPVAHQLIVIEDLCANIDPRYPHAEPDAGREIPAPEGVRNPVFRKNRSHACGTAASQPFLAPLCPLWPWKQDLPGLSEGSRSESSRELPEVSSILFSPHHVRSTIQNF